MKKILLLIVIVGLLQAAADAQWIQANGPFGATGNVLGTLDSTIFLGTESGGLYKSTDRGVTWIRLPTAAGIQTIKAFAADKPYAYAGSRYGIYRSTDNGETWASFMGDVWAFFSSWPQVYSFTLDGSDLYAGIGNRLLRTTDHGTTWVAADSGLPRTEVHSLVRTSQGIIAGLKSPGGIYMSTDQGITWNRLDSTNVTGDVTSLIAYSELHLHPYPQLPTSTDYIFASTPGGIRVNVDGSSSWAAANTGLPSISGKLFAAGGLASHSVYFLSTAGLFKSTNAGSSWNLVSASTMPGETAYDMCPVSDGLVIATKPHGAMKSTDGGSTFQYSGSGLVNMWVPAVGILDSTFFAAPWTDVLYKSTDFGASWTPTASASGPGRLISSLLGVKVRYRFPKATIFKALYAATADNGIWSSSDFGDTWVRSDTGLTTFSVNRLSYSSSLLGFTLYAATASGVGISVDGGHTWTMSKPADDDSAMVDVVATGGNIFAGAGGGIVYRSTDGGVSWTPLEAGRTKIVVRSLAVADTNVYVADPHGVSMMGANGDTWTSVSSGLASCDPKEFVTAAGGLILLHTHGAKYLPWSGNTWTELISGGEDFYCYSGATYGDLLLVGTYDGSTQYNHFNQILTDVPAQSVVAGAFGLSQNYPNPFNPATAISYQVSAAGNVKLAVYDVLGREVAILVNERKSPGSYTVRFDGSRLASGVYFYKLTAGNFIDTRKAVLLK